MGDDYDPVHWPDIVRFLGTFSERTRCAVERRGDKLWEILRSPSPRAERAKNLAAKVIDSFPVDKTDIEETASRKRRLLKRPEEISRGRFRARHAEPFAGASLIFKKIGHIKLTHATAWTLPLMVNHTTKVVGITCD